MTKQEESSLAPADAPPPRKRRSKLERRQIVEETLGTGISVARIARAHGVNANQVYQWRRLYHRGLLGPAGQPAALVPVHITDSVATTSRHHSRPPVSGAIDIESAKARLRIEGAPDPITLRLVLECLLG